MKKNLILLLFFLLLVIAIPFLSRITSAPEPTDDDMVIAKISAVAFAAAPAHANDSIGTEQASVRQPATVPLADAPETGFRVYDNAAETVLTVDARTFLIGTLACEMPASSPTEALKAQAVAAYTYYSRLRQNQRETDSAYDFTANTKAWLYYTTEEQLQLLWGSQFQANYDRLAAAVDAVEGETLRYDGALITAAYFAISSGQTENGADIWGGDCPYLAAVASPWDKEADGYQTTRTVSAADFRDKVLEIAQGCDFSGDPAAWIGAVDRTDSGSVTSMLVGGQPLDGVQMRNLFSLRSANFTVAYEDGAFTFTVVGYGHGVGMSQAGAIAMAEQGADYREILAWYYPGAELAQ